MRTFVSKTFANVIKSRGTETLEEVLPLLPKLSSAQKTQVWEHFTSHVVGDYIYGLTYAATLNVYDKLGQDALDTIRASTGRYKNDVVGELLYPEAKPNITKLLGLSEEGLDTLSLTTTCLRAWSKIKKGRDLFIPGLGSFDLLKVGAMIDSFLGSRTFSYRLHESFTINAVQALGYTGDLDNARPFRSKRMLNHIKKYWAEWKRIDFEHLQDCTWAIEGADAVVTTKEMLRLTPMALFETITNRRLEISSASATVSEYDHFKLPELPELQNVEFATVGTKLVKWGNEANVCIGSTHYFSKGVTGLSIFAKLVYKSQLVLCEFSREGKVKQLKGISNRAATMEEREFAISIGKKLVA